MFGVSSAQMKLEFTQLEEKISENVNLKIRNLFNNLIAAMITAGTVITVVTVGLILTPVLLALTISAEGYPFHAALVKISAIYGVSMLIVAPVVILLTFMKTYEIIKTIQFNVINRVFKILVSIFI